MAPKSFLVIQSAGIILFLSVTGFTDLCDKQKYTWQEQKYKSFYITGETSFVYFWTVLPRAIFRT